MAKRRVKLDYFVVCDDIRQEVGNKISLIGIYSNNIIQIPIPSVIPKLCFHLVFSHLTSSENLKLQLMNPDNVKVISIDNIELPKKRQREIAVLQAGFLGIKVDKEGTYRLLIMTGEEETLEQEIKIEIKKMG